LKDGIIETAKEAFEERIMKAYEVHGYNGTYLELEDGRFADTVDGDTSEGMEAHEALEVLRAEVTEHVTEPFSDWNATQMAVYVGAIEYDESITLREAADLYPLAYSTLAQYAREGRFEARRSGATWLTTMRAIEAAGIKPRS